MTKSSFLEMREMFFFSFSFSQSRGKFVQFDGRLKILTKGGNCSVVLVQLPNCSLFIYLF